MNGACSTPSMLPPPDAETSTQSQAQIDVAVIQAWPRLPEAIRAGILARATR